METNKVVAYIRVSTDNQAKEDRFGVDAQKKDIRTYANQNNLYISEWYTDCISGVKDERPELDKILFSEEVNNPPINAIIVAKTDRLARDINVYFYYKMLLKKKNIELISVSEDFGQFGAFAGMLESFVVCVAELERENINKRTSAGRAVKSAQGGYSGGRPAFGYSANNGRLIVNPKEAELVKHIFDLRAKGGTLRSITNDINLEGYRTRKDKLWNFRSIQVILANKKTYQGLYKYGDNDWVRGQHHAILEDD